MSVLWLLCVLSSAEEYWPVGVSVDDGLAVQIPKNGLEQIGLLASQSVPRRVDLAEVNQQTGGFSWGLSGGWVELQLAAINLVPSTGQLELRGDFVVQFNDDVAPFSLMYDANLGLFSLSDTCEGWVEPFDLSFSVPISLDVIEGVEGSPIVDVAIGSIALDYDLTNRVMFRNGCLGQVNTLMGLVGLDIYGFFFDLIRPVVDGVLVEVERQLDQQLNAALSTARVDQSFPLNGVDLSVQMYPTSVDIGAAGVQLVGGGLISASVAPCMEGSVLSGSIKTYSSVPPLWELSPSSHAALLLSDDLLNQGAYAFWAGGGLCLDLSDSSSGFSLPIPMNSGLFSILGSEQLGAVFRETVPVQILTQPGRAPLVQYDGPDTVDVSIRALRVDFIAEIDYRLARPIGLEVEVDLGLQVEFDPALGVMSSTLVLEDSALRVLSVHDELVLDESGAVAEGVQTLTQTLIPSFLGGDLFSSTLPVQNGVGLTALEIGVGGEKADWLVSQAALGSVSYEGQASGTGCGGATGCSTTSSGALWLFWLPLLVVRRRS